MKRKLDFTGERYGLLTIVQRVGKDKRGSSLWLCQCDCGRSTVAVIGNIRSGNTRSCGCLEDASRANSTRTHGRSRTAEYTAWCRMIARCENKNDRFYHCYGGRGIAVCSRWRESFEAFYEDMGPRPTSDYSLDRIDVNSGYDPSNCRWATQKEQARNHRDNLLITIAGETKCASEWAEQYGLPTMVVAGRFRSGWSPEDLGLPVQSPSRGTDGRFQKRNERSRK